MLALVNALLKVLSLTLMLAPVHAEVACCAILQRVGFTPTPGIPVFIVDTNGQAVSGGGVGQDGQAITDGNNGQAAMLLGMQMCTCSAGVANATYSGSGKIRLRGGNNSGELHKQRLGSKFDVLSVYFDVLSVHFSQSIFEGCCFAGKHHLRHKGIACHGLHST